MGFISSSTTTTLIAKLTPIGRKKLISTNNGLITSFSLGDSDANYNVSQPLTSGQVPTQAGDIGASSTYSNSTPQNTYIKNQLIVNPSGSLIKPVESQSMFISTEEVANGIVTLTGNSINKIIIDRTNTSDSYVNLYYSLGLPLSYVDDNTYTGITYANGGYSDTALSGLAQTKILLISIDNSKYGECLDGKTLKLTLTTTGGTYNIYSTFQNSVSSLSTQDANIRETSKAVNKINPNISFLFSDEILKPNGGDSTLSWGTGYNTVKPFSVNNKELFNLQTNTNLGLSADTAVGVVYLDKGLLVITNQDIVNDFDNNTSSASTLTLNSVSTSVYQNIVCLANRGEFGSSTNTTFTGSDSPRISEVGLYDNTGTLIALAKTDRHIVKNINEFLAMNIKITL